jgi:hypothetical protein
MSDTKRQETRDRSLEAALDLERVAIRAKVGMGGKEGRARYEAITRILHTLRSGIASSREIAIAEAEGRRILRKPFF